MTRQKEMAPKQQGRGAGGVGTAASLQGNSGPTTGGTVDKSTNIDSQSQARRPSFDVKKFSAGDLVLALFDEFHRQGLSGRRLFLWNGRLARLVLNQDTMRLEIETLTLDMLRYELALLADFYRGERATSPPEDVARMMMGASNPPFVPTLRRIVSVPIFTEDGTLLLEDGFDALSGVQVCLDQSVKSGGKALEVAEVPGPDDVEWARRMIDELLIDFPFEDEASRAHAIAMILTIPAKDLIGGPIPMFVIDAPVMGTGKSLLAEAILRVFEGDRLFVMACPRGSDDEEWRKALVSIVQGGAEAAVFDDAHGTIASGALSSFITSSTWRARILGGHKMAFKHAAVLLVLTSNNANIGEDLARRVIRVRLNAGVERPWLRQNFHHPDLLAWAKEHRALLVHAALVLIQNWIAKGRPAWSGTKLGRFERFCEVMGGILEAAGIPGFLENHEQTIEEAASSLSIERAFVEAWASDPVCGALPVTATELIRIAEQVEGLPINGINEARKAQSLSRFLNRIKDRVYGGWHIIRLPLKDGYRRWQIVKTKEPPSDLL